MVCFTGDLLDMFSGAKVPLPDQTAWVRSWLEAWPATTPLFVCSGNHDWWRDEGSDPDAERQWLRRTRRRGLAVDGDQKFWGGFRFICTPWLSSPEVDGPEPVVLLAHAPPEGTRIARDRQGGDVGDCEVACVAQQLAKGGFVLAGRVHAPGRWNARIGMACGFNPGVDFGAAVPNHIVIDPRRGRAEFHGSGQSHAHGKFAEDSLCTVQTQVWLDHHLSTSRGGRPLSYQFNPRSNNFYTHC